MNNSLRKTAGAALMLLAPLGVALVAQPAAAQTYQYRVATAARGTVDNVTVESDAGLRPGARLRLHVRATPNARWANVSLGNDVRVQLQERAPGDYVGYHVVARGDRLDPNRPMTVRAGWGEGPVAMDFRYPPSFLSAPMGAAPAALSVNSFAMWPRHGARVDPGEVLHFRVEATPNAGAWVDIPGVARGLRLREERPGVYQGSYTVRRRDDPSAFRDAVAMVRSGDQRVVARLNRGEDDRGYGDRR